MEVHILESILCVFLASLIVTVVFRKLKLSIILGYLLVGAILGPHAIGLVPNSVGIQELAEFGIVFLMFTVGLEFSLPKLFALKYPVFVIGGLQVILTIIITALMGVLLGMSKLSAVVVGSIVAMSSTAIVVKQLNDQLELHSSHGLNAISILLFQDLAVIPLIILIAGMGSGNSQSLTVILLWALLKGILAIFLIFLLGRWLLKPLFHLIAKTRAIELFTLTVLLVTLTSAWLTDFFGLSYALGAFLAGLMLAETEFRHQIEVEIRPFRDILLGLFFITIGMLTEISHWLQTWEWILLLFIALTVGKMILITVISRLSGNNLVTGSRTGLILAQGGEFGFAILTLALTDKILSPEYGQVVLAALLLSIAVSPLLIRFNQRITGYILPKTTKINEGSARDSIATLSEEFSQHAIICGYGRVGQNISRVLDKVNFPYICLDLDSDLVKRASLGGENVIYGDPSHPGILHAAGLDRAKIVVISFSDYKAALHILGMVKQTHPHLPVLVRCRDERELKELRRFGTTHIIAELFETSITLSHHLLQLIEIAPDKINELMQEFRSKDYDLLQKVFTGSYEELVSNEDFSYAQLRPILIPEGAYAVNKKLKRVKLKKTGVEIIAIRHKGTKHIKPHDNILLHANDIIVLFGTISDLEEAESLLLKGS